MNCFLKNRQVLSPIIEYIMVTIHQRIGSWLYHHCTLNIYFVGGFELLPWVSTFLAQNLLTNKFHGWVYLVPIQVFVRRLFSNLPAAHRCAWPTAPSQWHPWKQPALHAQVWLWLIPHRIQLQPYLSLSELWCTRHVLGHNSGLFPIWRRKIRLFKWDYQNIGKIYGLIARMFFINAFRTWTAW